MSGRMASIGISDVVTASVYSEKTRMKKLMMMNYYYYYENIARIDGFSRAPEIDFRYEIKARKVMVDFKFDALYQLSLHKEPPEVGLVKKLTGSLYWWVEQCVPTLHRECYRTL